MRISIPVRELLVNGYGQVRNKTLIAKVFGRQIVTYWCKRAYHKGRESFKGKPWRPKQTKLTPNIVEFILFLRVVFGWGTARIQQGFNFITRIYVSRVARRTEEHKECAHF